MPVRISYSRIITESKSDLSDAINAAGGDTSPTDSFDDLVVAIGNISGGSSVSELTRLNITSGQTAVVTYENTDITTSRDVCNVVYEYNQTTGHTQYNVAFDNGDSSDFTYDSDYVEFDGQMELINSYENNMSFVSVLGDGDLYELSITPSNFNEIDSLTYSFEDPNNIITLSAVPAAQVVKASGDINITNVESFDSIALTATETSNGVVKTAISFDGGTTYNSYYNSNWVTVDVDSTSDFATKGMTDTTINALTDTELSVPRGSSNTMRFAYYLNEPAVSDNANVDNITLTVTLIGTDDLCDTSKYSVDYDFDLNKVTYTFSADGTYTVVYAD